MHYDRKENFVPGTKLVFPETRMWEAKFLADNDNTLLQRRGSLILFMQWEKNTVAIVYAELQNWEYLN